MDYVLTTADNIYLLLFSFFADLVTAELNTFVSHSTLELTLV